MSAGDCDEEGDTGLATKLARERKVSVGHLIRSACRKQYSLGSKEERLSAVRALCQLELPVESVVRMKRESVTDPAALMP
jgi:hypothetical protein